MAGQKQVMDYLIELRKNGEGWITNREVLEALDISYVALTKIMKRLVAYNFVDSRPYSAQAREFRIKSLYIDSDVDLSICDKSKVKKKGGYPHGE